VIWSAGTYDALARVEIDSFVRQVAETLEWLRSRQIDAVVVEPPYAAAVADDEHYSLLVKRLRETAERLRVPVVLRYEAMRYLAVQQPSTAGQHFRLHDLSRRCTPEYVARAIDASLAPSQRTPADGGGAPR
jgi:tRNA G10  N-methylase Trm11